MRQCVLLSMDDMNGFPRDDQLLIEPLKDLGWEAKEISWHHNEEWARFEAAVIRSTWDYQHHMKK